MVVWSHSSADPSVVDTTYLGIALSRSAIGPVWSRHARAKPCQVSRGSSSASAASARSSAPCRPASLMYGKSASAGGASMTPSSVACVCAVIEVMRVRPPAAAQLIAAHETDALAGLTAVEQRRTRSSRRPATGLSSQCHEQGAHRPPRTTSFSVEAGEAAVDARPATVASDEYQESAAALASASVSQGTTTASRTSAFARRSERPCSPPCQHLEGTKRHGDLGQLHTCVSSCPKPVLLGLADRFPWPFALDEDRRAKRLFVVPGDYIGHPASLGQDMHPDRCIECGEPRG